MVKEDQKQESHALRVELFIAHLLRWGVMTSFVVIAIGIASVVGSGQTGYHQIQLDDIRSLVQYRPMPDFPNTLGDVFDGVRSFKPYAIIVLGLLILIAIPVMRVAVSVIAFALEHDWLYVLITGFVLVMLLISFAIGEAGG
jgi:uncharacterized membrane protein